MSLLLAGIASFAASVSAEETEVVDTSNEWKKAGSEIEEAAHAVEKATVESSRAIWKTTREESSKVWNEAREKSRTVWEQGKAKIHEATAPKAEKDENSSGAAGTASE